MTVNPRGSTGTFSQSSNERTPDRGAPRRRPRKGRSGRGGSPGSRVGGQAFVLYVEGARDRDLLRIWARRMSHGLAKALERHVVILGGRQPARALAHFRDLRLREPDVRGLVVIDRDGQTVPQDLDDEAGLELFVWGRRHIESYVLVPSAIRRALGFAPDDPRVDRALAEHLPAAGDSSELELVDAKRLLAGRGPLSQSLGRVLVTADIAKCMREDEIHVDVRELLDRLGRGLGLSLGHPEIVVRDRGS